ncbi:hypothetical protein [Thermospira aquatica]|uniref:Uncharacterized protein n=1 Tax=Thermospira aquatica TaxID=2828656 RepID=A0AAX3BGD0_9SPIR|nr:hypothetical protein [Thermospira aquatica]URA11168.1 hypothetical protein KDW03_05070 [Thermospira aquatica]
MKRLIFPLFATTLLWALGCTMNIPDSEGGVLGPARPPSSTNTNANDTPQTNTNTSWVPPDGYLVYDHSPEAIDTLQKITYATTPEYFVLASSTNTAPYGAILYHLELPSWLVNTDAFSNINVSNVFQWYFTNFFQQYIFDFCFSNRGENKAWRLVLGIIRYNGHGLFDPPDYLYFRDVVNREFPEEGEMGSRPSQWYISAYESNGYNKFIPDSVFNVFLTPPAWQLNGQKVPAIQYAWLFKFYKNTSNRYVQFAQGRDYQGMAIDPNTLGSMRLYLYVTSNRPFPIGYYYFYVAAEISNFISGQQLVITNNKTYFIFNTNGVAHARLDDDSEPRGHMIFWRGDYDRNHDLWYETNYVAYFASNGYYHTARTHISTSDQGDIVFYTNAPRLGVQTFESAKSTRLASFSFPFRVHCTSHFDMAYSCLYGPTIQPVWIRIGNAPSDYVRGIIMNVCANQALFSGLGMAVPDSFAGDVFMYEYARNTFSFFIFVPEEDFHRVTNALN